MGCVRSAPGGCDSTSCPEETVFLRTGPRCLSLRYQTLRCWTAVVRCTETGAWEYSWCRSVCLDGNRPFASVYRRVLGGERSGETMEVQEPQEYPEYDYVRAWRASQAHLREATLTPTLATCQKCCQTSRVNTHARRAAHDRTCARTAARREKIGATLGGGRFLHFARKSELTSQGPSRRCAGLSGTRCVVPSPLP